MSVKQPLKLGCIARRAVRRHGLLAKRHSLCRLGMLGLNPSRGRRNKATSVVATPETTTRWNLQVDVERAKDDYRYSLPLLIYLYSPWQLVITKWNIWKLKLFWDWHFSEAQFVDTSKQAVVVVTKYIREQRGKQIKRCTTPMGYKQIMHDLIEWKSPKSKDWPQQLLRFEKRHIRRAILLKVQKLPHYDHKFAFADVVFCAFRRTNDYNSQSEINEMSQLIDEFVETKKLLVPYPIVVAEFFVRFRRDYSYSATVRSGHWLISTFKILKLDLLNYHPEFYVGSRRGSEQINHTSSGVHNKM